MEIEEKYKEILKRVKKLEGKNVNIVIFYYLNNGCGVDYSRSKPFYDVTYTINKEQIIIKDKTESYEIDIGKRIGPIDEIIEGSNIY